jgi:hypothetical protein
VQVQLVFALGIALSVSLSSPRIRWWLWDRAYQLRGIVSLGIPSGHFFEPPAAAGLSGTIEHTSDKLEGLGDELLTVVRHFEWIEGGIGLERRGFLGSMTTSMELGAFWMERLKASTLSARIRWFDFPAAQCMPQAASGQWRKASGLVGPAARNCTSDVRSANSKHSFQGRQFPIESPHLDLSSTLSTPFKMRSTAALRMFRQTPRMMRPIPVSICNPMTEGTSSLALGSV